uniref:Uncharacterized protein n=1 Tax=Musca domestica TaxID=7370 RepID=A0A1I8NG80_MUSDO
MKMNYIVIYVILLILPVQGANKKKSRSVYFLEIKNDYSKKYFKSIQVNISSRRDSMNVLLEIAHDITNVWASAGVALWQKSTKQFQSMFTYDLDLCDMLLRLKTSKIQLLNKWIGNFLKYGNISKQCPFNRGTYYFNNLKVDRDSIPGFAPNGKFKVYLNPYEKKENGSKDVITDAYMIIELR